MLGFLLQSNAIVNHKGWTEENALQMVKKGDLFEFIVYMMFFQNNEKKHYQIWKSLFLISIEKGKFCCIKYLFSYGTKRNFHMQESFFYQQSYILCIQFLMRILIFYYICNRLGSILMNLIITSLISNFKVSTPYLLLSGISNVSGIFS